MIAPAAVILAAGESRRMGRTKALLIVEGETFADRLVRVFSTICDPVIVVTGAQQFTVCPPARVIHNAEWRQGQLTSLQAGLRAAGDAVAVFFAPVDCPLFRQETIASLWGRWQRDESMFAIPRMGGRRGHPVLASRAAVDEILALPAEAQARDVVHRHRDRTVYVEVDDDGIFSDIDTPEDYRALTP